MAETVAPEFARFVESERRAKRLPQATRKMAEGEVFEPVFIEAGRSIELMRVASRRAAGFFRPTQRSEVVWVEGENELAVGIAGVDVKLGDGLIAVGSGVIAAPIFGPIIASIVIAAGGVAPFVGPVAITMEQALPVGGFLAGLLGISVAGFVIDFVRAIGRVLLARAKNGGQT